jgi:predicted RNA-binding Zn-ribbon protein involved in translation (DUF1610 family)
MKKPKYTPGDFNKVHAAIKEAKKASLYLGRVIKKAHQELTEIEGAIAYGPIGVGIYCPNCGDSFMKTYKIDTDVGVGTKNRILKTTAVCECGNCGVEFTAIIKRRSSEKP